MESVLPKKQELRHHGFAPNDVRFLSEGPPVLMGDRLPIETYVEVKARKLAKAKVLWINFEILRERGISVPKEGLTPEFEQQVLDAFAFSIAKDTDAPDSFTEEERTFYADRYGGDGLEGNWGSGRAASAGQIQIKGIGKTSLVGTNVEDHHAHGGVSKCEAVMEAIWGEINYRELPFDGSRVIAVIDTGTFTPWKDGGHEPRALIVRFDPIRPAHFIPKAPFKTDLLPAHAHHIEADAKRVPEALKLLTRSLPLPSLSDGLREFARRIGVHTAVSFARGFHHGTTAPSNREMSGGFLDFGTQTAQPVFGHVFVLPEVAPAGPDFEEIKETNDVLVEAAEKIVEDPSELPSKRELSDISVEAYQRTLEKEFLCLTGVSRDIVYEIFDTPVAQDLVQSLLQIAREGALKISVDKDMPEGISKYDLRRMLIAVADVHDQGIDAIAKAIGSEMNGKEGHLSSPQYQKVLTNLFAQFFEMAKTESLKDHELSEKGFRNFIIRKTRQKNRIMPELYRHNMRNTNNALIDLYQYTGNRTPLWDNINERIRRNTRTYQDVGRFQVVYSELRDPLEYSFFRYYFDAKKNSDMMMLTLTVENGITRFRYKSATEPQVAEARLVLLNTATGQEIASVTPRRFGTNFEFKATAEFTGIEPKNIEALLLDKENVQLMKIDVRDLIIEHRAPPIPPPSPITGAQVAGVKPCLSETRQ